LCLCVLQTGVDVFERLGMSLQVAILPSNGPSRPKCKARLSEKQQSPTG
jgi:hypothetical protein